jgi:hypothetical protein
LFFQGDLQREGRHWVDASIEQVDANNDLVVLGRLWVAAAQLGSGKRTVAACEKAIELFESNGDARDLAVAHLHLGSGLLRTGHLSDARTSTEHAIELMIASDLARRAQDVLLTAIATQQLAAALALKKRPKIAATLIGYVDSFYRYPRLMKSSASQLDEVDLRELMSKRRSFN